MRDGKITNVFTGKNGVVEAGLRLVEGKIKQFATDIKTGEDLNIAQPYFGPLGEKGMEVLYNPLSDLKPRALPMALGRQPVIPENAEDCRLLCVDAGNPQSIVKRPVMLESKFSNFTWRLVPNLMPWDIRGLMMWVRSETIDGQIKIPHDPQALTKERLEDFLGIVKKSTGVATFYNSLHGGASANHFHFQAVYCQKPMAVEFAGVESLGKYGILKNYPCKALVFPLNISSGEIWGVIEKVQALNYPFNLIALKRGIYLFVRKPEAEVISEFPDRAFGAINFAGLFITASKEELESVTEEIVSKAYKKMTVEESVLKDLI